MIINRTQQQSNIVAQKQVAKKEGFQEPKEQVTLSSTTETPDFLKKPQFPVQKNLDAELGKAGVSVVKETIRGGIFGALKGTVCSLIGYTGSAIAGPIGGIVTSAVLGGVGFITGAAEEKTTGRQASLMRGLVNGGANAAAAYLGSTGNIGTGILVDSAIFAARGALNPQDKTATELM